MLRLVGGVLIACGLATTALADLKSDLAEQFNADARYFILNLPPKPSGWPGSIYTSDMRFVVTRGTGDDPKLERSPPSILLQALASNSTVR